MQAIQGKLAQPDVFPSSLEAASRQREEVSSAYMKVCEMVMGMGGLLRRRERSRRHSFQPGDAHAGQSHTAADWWCHSVWRDWLGVRGHSRQAYMPYFHICFSLVYLPLPD